MKVLEQCLWHHWWVEASKALGRARARADLAGTAVAAAPQARQTEDERRRAWNS